MVAEIVNVDIGTMMIAGLVIGGCSSVVSLAAARMINRIVNVPLRFDEENEDDDSAEDRTGESSLDHAEQESAAEQLTGQRPSLFRSLIPIAVPVLLIAVGSVVAYLLKSESLKPSAMTDLLASLGNKNIALAVGAALALSLIQYCPVKKRVSLVSRSLASAGNIILITAAGGAFGAMLRQAGIGDAVGSMARDVPGLMILPVAFAVTAAIRTLQGSATVAMITAAGVLQGFAHAEGLPFHPVYLAMAIGAGSKPVSWMTDSAFWVITRMSGMTEGEGLRVISPMSICMGFSALFFTMTFAWLYPGL
jgi:GntP family gluconate:H+ symporter